MFYRQQGLTSKNLTLIRQVLNRNVWASVVNLPHALMAQARLMEEHARVKAAITYSLTTTSRMQCRWSLSSIGA